MKENILTIKSLLHQFLNHNDTSYVNTTIKLYIINHEKMIFSDNCDYYIRLNIPILKKQLLNFNTLILKKWKFIRNDKSIEIIVDNFSVRNYNVKPIKLSKKCQNLFKHIDINNSYPVNTINSLLDYDKNIENISLNNIKIISYEEIIMIEKNAPSNCELIKHKSLYRSITSEKLLKSLRENYNNKNKYLNDLYQELDIKFDNYNYNNTNNLDSKNISNSKLTSSTLYTKTKDIFSNEKIIEALFMDNKNTSSKGININIRKNLFLELK